MLLQKWMGVTPENAEFFAGVYTYTFEDGQATVVWTFGKSQESFRCTASYTIMDNLVRISYKRGDGCGEGVAHDDIQWRLENDGLHISLVETTFNEVA
jgi:hypothetical protein